MNEREGSIPRMPQNLYEMFSTDPVEFNIQALKAKLAIALVEFVRAKGWNQTKAASHLRITQPRMSNLARGRLEKFSIDFLLGMLVLAGYKLETDFDPANSRAPLSLTIKKTS